MAEVASLKQDIRGLRHENRVLHMLANNYSTNMKSKLDQLLEFEGRTQNDNQEFKSLFQRHPLSQPSGVSPSTEASNNQHLVPLPSGVFPSTKASHEQPL
ncbi:hypothetical protein TB1_026842 [Malus domestica]